MVPPATPWRNNISEIDQAADFETKGWQIGLTLILILTPVYKGEMASTSSVSACCVFAKPKGQVHRTSNFVLVAPRILKENVLVKFTPAGRLNH